MFFRIHLHFIRNGKLSLVIPEGRINARQYWVIPFSVRNETYRRRRQLRLNPFTISLNPISAPNILSIISNPNGYKSAENAIDNDMSIWELSKTLDPGTSNEDIESILQEISHLVHGAKLLGAGGGGFLFMVTKGVRQIQQIIEILVENPPNNRVRFFDFDIDQDGLKVSVL